MIRLCILVISLFVSVEVYGESTNVLNFSCQYDPSLIKKKQKKIGFLEYDKLDRLQICRAFGCEDTVEINKYSSQSDGEVEYRLRNSWFNHQGILLDDFLITENSVTINTFVSQAYFLESYLIDRITGKTTKTFYRFDDPEFFDQIIKLEKSTTKKIPLYNKNGKLSLKTLNSLSLEPSEILYFEGKCLEGIGI